MFATLLGRLPRPPLPDDADPLGVLDAVLGAQIDHGLEPLTAAGWDVDRSDPVGSWRIAQRRAGEIAVVKAVVTGPLTSGRPAAEVRETIAALADAGCPWIEIDEPVAHTLAGAAGRARFVEAHRSLTAGIDGVHLSLALTGGDADHLGAATIAAFPYASLAVDLIAGPDNWRLVATWPGDRGVVAGALQTKPDGDDGPEVLLYAAGYAASTGGRDGDRVGLGTAGGLGHLPWAAATRKLRRLGEAARLATASPDEVRSAVDPRALDSRSAALGGYAPPPTGRPARHRSRS